MSDRPVNDVGRTASGDMRIGFAGLITALIVAIADQANKWWLLEVYNIDERGLVTVLPFLDIVYVQNLGVSYGLFRLDSEGGQQILAAFAFAVSFIFLIWMFRTSSRTLSIGLGLVIGGAVGNAIDRLVLGGVADFYSLHAFGYRWYIFNLADVAIVAGAALLLYDSFWLNRKSALKGS